MVVIVPVSVLVPVLVLVPVPVIVGALCERKDSGRTAAVASAALVVPGFEVLLLSP